MSWPLVKLGELVKVKGGKRLPKGTGYSESETKYPYIRVTDFKNNSVRTSGLVYIEKEVQEKIARYTISSDDVYISIAGTIGIVGIVPDELNGANLTENAAKLVINDKEELDKNYLVRFLSTAGQNQLHERKKTTSQPKLALFRIEEVEIPLPPLDEQKRIAAILDKADSVRRKRQQAIELADDFLRSVFLDMFGDPVTNPKRWEVKPLSELIAKGDKLNYGVVQPGDNVDDGVPLIRSGDLGDTGTDLNKIRKVSTLIDEKHKKSRLKGNEILIACVGSIGKVGWVNESMIGWNIARAVTRIPLSNDVNREYVYRYLQSPVIQGYFQRETRAVAQPTLNVGLIGKTPIALPPMELQEEFLKVFSNVVSIKRKYSENGTRDSEFFNAISQKAFAGEL